MKTKKSTIILIVVALLYLTHTTVKYFMVIDLTTEIKEKIINVSK